MEDTFPDLGSLEDKELKGLIEKLTEEEQEVSYRRRVLHGKIDILRAELVNRLRKKHEGGEDVISGADVQRLTDILAGAIVAWEFELLPRWALLVLAAREAFMLLLTQVALRRGMDLKVNMMGRWAVWPVTRATMPSR